MALSVELFTTALATLGRGDVVALSVDPLDTDVGVVAGCLQAVLDVAPDKRPGAVLIMFVGPAVALPLWTSPAVCAWATRFVGSRCMFDTLRGLSDDRKVHAMSTCFHVPPLAVASRLGCGRAKLLALAGYNDGLGLDGDGVPMWSLDKAGEAILESWIKCDVFEAHGEAPDAESMS